MAGELEPGTREAGAAKSTDGRLNRRRFLKATGLAVGAAALGALPGCGENPPVATPAAPAKSTAATPAAATGATPAAPAVIKATDELIVAFAADPGHMDPRVEGGVPGFSIEYPHMYEAIVWRKGDTALDASTSLAESWEQVNPTTLRFKLRKGVKFHNGDEFDAEAVKFSHEQYVAPESKHPIKSAMVVAKEVRVVDKYTAEYVTSVPSRPLLRILEFQAMLSPRAFKELGPKIATNPVGTGPYKFVEYAPGQHIIMEANPSYWGPPPKSKRLRIRFIPENGTRLAALESGEVMMMVNVPPDSIKRLESNPQLELRSSVTNRIMFITIRNDRKPFDDKRVRQALNYAIDKDALTKDILGGKAPVAKAPIPPAVFGAHPGLPVYQYDPDKAKRLLAEAGASGATFNLGVPNGRYLLDKQIGEAIAGYLSDVGLKVNYENPDWSSFVTEISKFQKSKYDGYLFGWGVVTGEPDQLVREHFYSKFAVTRTAYQNPEVDRLIDEAAESFDEAKVKAAYAKAQEIVWDECPWIWLYLQPELDGANKRLQGFNARPDEWLVFTQAYLT